MGMKNSKVSTADEINGRDNQMNLAHLRIRGMPAMRYVVNLRALGLNIRRCAAIAP